MIVLMWVSDSDWLFNMILVREEDEDEKEMRWGLKNNNKILFLWLG